MTSRVDDRRPQRTGRQGTQGRPLLLEWHFGHSDDGAAEPPTDAALAVLDELRSLGRVQVELLGAVDRRPDLFDLLEYGVGSGLRMRFSTFGEPIDALRARWLAAAPTVEVALVFPGWGNEDGASALRALRFLADAGATRVSVCGPLGDSPTSEVMLLADRCHARLRMLEGEPGARPAPIWPVPPSAQVWLIETSGQVHRRGPEGLELGLGNVLESGGFLSAWRRANS